MDAFNLLGKSKFMREDCSMKAMIIELFKRELWAGLAPLEVDPGWKEEEKLSYSKIISDQGADRTGSVFCPNPFQIY